MAVLTGSKGQLHTAQTGDSNGTDQVSVPDAENIVIQASENNTGSCDVHIEQQLPGMTTWANRLNYTLAQATSRVDVVSRPVGLIRVRTANNVGDVDVYYHAHYPR